MMKTNIFTIDILRPIQTKFENCLSLMCSFLFATAFFVPKVLIFLLKRSKMNGFPFCHTQLGLQQQQQSYLHGEWKQENFTKLKLLYKALAYSSAASSTAGSSAASSAGAAATAGTTKGTPPRE